MHAWRLNEKITNTKHEDSGKASYVNLDEEALLPVDDRLENLGSEGNLPAMTPKEPDRWGSENMSSKDDLRSPFVWSATWMGDAGRIVYTWSGSSPAGGEAVGSNNNSDCSISFLRSKSA